jgi:hypothetical protein
MTSLHFLLFSIFFTLTLTENCYETSLTFGEDECRNVTFSEIFRGLKCKYLACTTYYYPLQAHICIEIKTHEINFIIVEKNLTFHIKTFRHDSPYSVTFLAITGIHVSLMLHSVEGSFIEAYRMSFNYTTLDPIRSNPANVTHLGRANDTNWTPLCDSDFYYKEGMKDVQHYWFNNTLNKNPYFEIKKQCLAWEKSSEINSSSSYTTNTIAIFITKLELTTLSTPSLSITTSVNNIQKSSFWSSPVNSSAITAIAIIVLALVIYLICQGIRWIKRQSNPSGYHQADIELQQIQPQTQRQVSPPSYHTNDSSRLDNRRSNEQSQQNGFQTQEQLHSLTENNTDFPVDDL